MRKLLLLCLLALPTQIAAQEAEEMPRRMLLEAGIVGGKSPACPGHYVGLEGRVAGPVSLYGMVETYRCLDVRRGKARLPSGCKSRPATVTPAGSSQSDAWR